MVAGLGFMMKYINNSIPKYDDNLNEIMEIIGIETPMRIKTKNGEIMELEIDDSSLSTAKKEQLQLVLDKLALTEQQGTMIRSNQSYVDSE